MPVAARIGSTTTAPHNGTLIGQGARTVLIGKLPAAVAQDPTMTVTAHQCSAPTTPPHPPTFVTAGSATVFLEKRPAARVGDQSACGATIASGAVDVFLGG